MGLFHEEIVASLKNLPLEVCLVCARRVTPKTSTEDMSLRGTIVDNMAVGRTEKAFASRVSEIDAESLRRATVPNGLFNADKDFRSQMTRAKWVMPLS